jgi:hypothetical protein
MKVNYVKMIHDYKINDPKGWCGDPKRGAALGRPAISLAPEDWSGKLYLSKIRLDSGGYDKNGTYFGIGPPSLYWYVSEDNLIDAMIRANDREAAKKKILEIYKNAKFHR